MSAQHQHAFVFAETAHCNWCTAELIDGEEFSRGGFWFCDEGCADSYDEEPEDIPSPASERASARFARYERQRNGGHLTPRQIRRIVKKGGACGSLKDEDGTTCFLPFDHKLDFHESSTGPWWPWLHIPVGEHSVADEYPIYPAERTCYGDTFAY